jgi:glycosyltransferase involved in cell wall biosynthesis
VTAFFAVVYTLMTMVLAANLVHLARRGRKRRPFGGRVSVLIPARNEAANLERLLPSLLGQQGVDFEVIVYDDASEDDSAAVLRAHADERLHLVAGGGPPPGWVGKVHALDQAARHATGDVLFFLDADTAFTDNRALERIMSRLAALPPHSVLTGLPHFRGGAPLLVSFLPYGLLVNQPLPLTERLRSRLTSMNGQCWLIHRADYAAHEPHRAHPSEVLEDIRIGQYLSVRGVIPHYADLKDDLEVWMYRDTAEAWRGFRKNAYLLTGGHPGSFAFFWAMFVLTLIIAPAWSPLWLLWAIGTKFAADRFARYPLWVTLLAPVTYLLWAVLLLDSFVSHQRGRVDWKGRGVALRRRSAEG